MWLYINSALTPPILKPPPSACEEFVAFEATTIILSLMSTTVELIVVVVPSTCKSPKIITLPVISPCPEGSIVNVEGTFKVVPLIKTLFSDVSPVIRRLEPVILENVVLPLIFRLPPIERSLKIFTAFN